MNFWFGKRISLVDKVIEKAKEMGGGVELTCCTFDMPQAAGVKLNRAVADGILSHVTVYMEGGHRRKKNWVQAMIKMGWTIELVDNHKAWIIKLTMDEALKDLKPVDPA